jgi:hypothetical protein
MNCRDIERIFIEQDPSATLPLPPEVEEHVTICSRCSEVVRALRMPDGKEMLTPTALSRLASDLAADLLPARPLAPMGFYLAGLAGTFGSIVAFGVYLEGTFALSAMSPLQTVSILSALGACASLLAWSLVHQMVPGSRHRFRPEFLPAAVIASLSLVVGVLFQFRDETLFWKRGWACLEVGLPFDLLAAVPLWLILRRGTVLSPRVTGAATGLLAGLSGMSVLEIHCPRLGLWHILVWHLGVAILSVVGGLCAGGISEILDRYSARVQPI